MYLHSAIVLAVGIFDPGPQAAQPPSLCALAKDGQKDAGVPIQISATYMTDMGARNVLIDGKCPGVIVIPSFATSDASVSQLLKDAAGDGQQKAVRRFSVTVEGKFTPNASGKPTGSFAVSKITSHAELR